jgi:putative tryptophan/tyrosine transport system substrate-binding protein
MKRRDFIRCLGSLALTMGSSGPRAQTSSRMFRVGTLSPGTPMTESVYGPALVRGLAQHGYILGRNLIIETRAAGGHLERIPALIHDLIANKVDVMVVQGYPPALAAKQIGTLPTVVLGGTGDPVATGLIASLARPGGNITGISDVSAQLSPKRLELLKDLIPTLKQVAMLWNANDLGMTLRVRESEQAARALNLSVQALGVREPNDFAAAFAAMISCPTASSWSVTRSPF